MSSPTVVVDPRLVTRTTSREILAWIAAAAAIVSAYFWKLGAVPAGLFVDETSVGYNARAIGRTLSDASGTNLPLFVKVLANDYRGPLYVYPAAISELLFGPTPFAVRLPAVLYAFGMAAGIWWLVRSMTNRSPLARWVALASLACPAVFTFGRIAVTDASCLPFFLVLALCAARRVEQSPTFRRSVWLGLAIGVLGYSYTTARLYAPLLAVAAALIFWLHRRAWTPAVGVACGALLAGAPVVAFMLAHPGALTTRFNDVSVFAGHPGAAEVARRIAGHYWQHLASVEFLFQHGDHNLRHNIGVGLLPVWLALPLAFGIWSVWSARILPSMRLLLVALVLAPIPVALCHDAWPHASRMIQLAPLAYLFSAVGFDRLPKSVIAAVAALAVLETCQFAFTYFGDYGSASAISVFDAPDRDIILAAKARQLPGEAIVIKNAAFEYDGTEVAFWLDLDPAKLREIGFEGLGVFKESDVRGQ